MNDASTAAARAPDGLANVRRFHQQRFRAFELFEESIGRLVTMT